MSEVASTGISEIWAKISPSSLITKVRQRSNLFKIATNTGWLVVDKLISIVAGLLVGAWVARYLGPAQYGMLNYASAFVALFTPLVGLGLKDIVIREIVRDPADKDEILGTAFTLQFLAGFIALGLSIGIAYVSRPDDALARCLIAILSGRLIFLAGSNTLSYWFQSQIQSKFSVWARNLALVVIALVRVGLVLSQARLVAFAWAMLASNALVVLGMVVGYRASQGRIAAWRTSFLQAKQLLKDSWPLIISGVAVTIYMKVDQIMLGNMVTEGELGVYSAAVRLSELWYFIPTAIASSFFPTIIRSRENKSEQVHRERMQLFFDIMAGTAYLVVIPTAVLAPLVVTTLFGADYAEAGLILRVHIWAFLFVSLGTARSRWLMAENMTRFSMTATILGAIVNVGLNFWLIPQYAGLGAAWATLASQAVSAYLSSMLLTRLWPVFRQLTTSLLAPFRLLKILRSLRQIV
jgi:PST family polysaccharide transporter